MSSPYPTLPGELVMDPPVLPDYVTEIPSTAPVFVVPIPGPPGDDGVDGDPGPPGPSGVYFEYVQTIPAATWIINHNLGHKVSVTIFDVLGNVVYADVQHGSVNQATITFPGPYAGSAVVIS